MTVIVYLMVMVLGVTSMPMNNTMNITTTIKNTSTIVEETIYADVTGTVYHATPDQTDDTPLITADGSKIDVNRINEIRWIAVSRDLINLKTPKYHFKGKLNFGDTVWIGYDKNALLAQAKKHNLDSTRTANLIKKYDQIVGWWVVKDTMGDYFWEKTKVKSKDMTIAMIKSSHYKTLDGYVYQKHYQRKWIDFLQNSKTGMLDYWNKNIIITKRKTIENENIRGNNDKIPENKRKTDDV